MAPALVIIGSAGIFSLRSSVFDVAVSWFFAYVGYIFRKYDYPPIAVLLGVILGPIIDAEIYRVNIIYGDNLTALITRPVVLGSFIAAIFFVMNPIVRYLRSRWIVCQAATDSE